MLISEQIEATLRTLLKEELGEFRAGMPAIAVEPPQMPNSGSGLHVSIERHPRKLSQGTSRLMVTLRQYDRSPLGLVKFDNAIEKMKAKFPLGTDVIPPFEADKVTQAVFQIDCYQYYSGLAIAESV